MHSFIKTSIKARLTRLGNSFIDFGYGEATLFIENLIITKYNHLIFDYASM